ncbi:hypothetical protein ACFL30_04425, partial [Candidatus Latescibacterota bacterium]
MRGLAIVVLCAPVLIVVTNSAETQERRGIIGFERNDRVFTWQTLNKGDVALTDKLGVRFDSELKTSLNQRSGSNVKDRWYDKVYNQTELNYDVTDRLRMKVQANEDWNKDTMNTLGKSMLTTNYGGLLRYTRSRDFWFEGEIENTYDTRFNNEDKGSTAKTKGWYTGTPLRSRRNLQAHFDVDAGKSNLKRKKDQLILRGNLDYNHELADISMTLYNRQTIRGYFSDLDRKNVEERKQVDQNVELTVTHGDPDMYRKKAALTLSMKLGRGSTDDSANEIENSSKYHNNSSLGLRDFNMRVSKKLIKWVSAGLETGYRKDEKDVQNKLRSRSQTDILTRGDLIVSLGASDSLTAFGWIKRTRIDTPQGVPNDRDELKFETGVQYNHLFSHIFKIAIDFRVLETHYVNIDVSQSSQNKWMKTYILSPYFIYMPASFLSIRHGINVYANYIEYDFENPILLKSNITRRFSSETWIQADISSKIRAQLG